MLSAHKQIETLTMAREMEFQEITAWCFKLINEAEEKFFGQGGDRASFEEAMDQVDILHRLQEEEINKIKEENEQ